MAISLTKNNQPENDASEPRASFKQRLLAGGICFFSFMLFYILSAGPMAWLTRIAKVEQFENATKTLYLPLVFIVKHNLHPLSDIIQWYVGLFK